jgi:hypothetical protein
MAIIFHKSTDITNGHNFHKSMTIVLHHRSLKWNEREKITSTTCLVVPSLTKAFALNFGGGDEPAQKGMAWAV